MKLGVICMLFVVTVAACKSSATGFTADKFPGNETGAKALLQQFLKPGADFVALSTPLIPSKADMEAVFESKELAANIYEKYAPLFKKSFVLKPNQGQTELLLWEATTDDLKANTGNTSRFPGGYRDVARHLKSGLKVYRWKFVEPGKTLGMAFDGLYFVNGHWVVIPKPWRAIR